MKIIFSTFVKDLNVPPGDRFSRVPGFPVCDPDNEVFQIMNRQQGMYAAHGAGIQPAEVLAGSEAKAADIEGHWA